jgi:hypothetical protein
MTDITNIEASQRVLAHLHEGRLVQGTWHRKRDGRELACMLGAIAPGIDDFRKCPASVMPKWLARLVVVLFDGQAKDAAMTWAARFGTQMARWHVLDSVAWDRVRDAFCSACVEDARLSAASAASSDYANAADYAAAAARAAARAADAAARAAAAYAYAADAAAYAADAAAAVAFDADAANASCWTRMATALCDLIDAELAALAAKET